MLPVYSSPALSLALRTSCSIFICSLRPLTDSMLTLQKHPIPPYGYKAVHDLPTPPSAINSPITNSSSTYSLPWREPLAPLTMSAPHRGLPLPPAMSMTPQQATTPHPPALQPSHQHSHQPPPPVHHSQQHPLPPQPAPSHHQHQPQHHHRDSWAPGPAPAPAPAAPFPPPPQHWSNSDESMRNWLLARTEEEKTRQEEEKTRQEGLRLEQRKIEMDMLRSSLSGGIPPPMIPLVFTGMASGGILPQTALDWAHQFMVSQQQQYPQLPPPPPRPLSPESQREAAAQPPAQYHPPPNLPPPHGGAYAAYATSPTRARGQTVSTVARPAAGSNISSAGSNTPQSGGLQPSTSTLGPFQPQQSSGGQPTQHDSTLYFHHWLPPATQSGQSSGASNRPSSPAGESQKKRKAAADPSHHSRTSSTQRPRSPPTFVPTDFAGAPGRKSHKRHKSDVSWHHAPRHAIGASHDSRHRARTPAQDNSSTSSKDREVAEGSRRDSQSETYARPRQEDEGQNRDREREREASAAPGERAA